jgi:membrane dipeptidase
MRQGGVALQFFAAWVDVDADIAPRLQAMQLTDDYYHMLEQSEGALVPLSPTFTPGQGQVATVLTLEGGEAIDGSLELLRDFYHLGVRAMTLTWNQSNELASPATRRINRGLTPLGRRVAREMARIGMALDVAHLSDAGIDEALDLGRPLFTSHTNARAVCPHRRSLCDRHIKAIAGGGGVICVNFYPPQLCARGESSTADIARHIAYIADLGGVEHVALGSDFDGMYDYPADIKNQAQLPNLLLALREAGFAEQEIERIAYDNLHDYIVQFV